MAPQGDLSLNGIAPVKTFVQTNDNSVNAKPEQVIYS